MTNCDHNNGNNPTWMLTDARGIPCGLVCGDCEAQKRAEYRPEVMNDPDYEANESIEPQD